MINIVLRTERGVEPYYEALDKVWEDAGMVHGPSNLGG